MESPERRPSPRRDPRKVVAAFTAALLASAWLAVAAWGNRHSPTPVGPAKDRRPKPAPSPSYDTQPYGQPPAYDQSQPGPSQGYPDNSAPQSSAPQESAPQMSTGQS
ncbi:MAG: hypothetical protein QOE06_3600 [Thermoleophilaceae bacterium]|jgi:hypothetical protein|nr:hypothetical protein [Thermoleophilaceae bacterium]